MTEESFWKYAFPFPPTYKVEIEPNSVTHSGPYEHAIDFLMPDGSEVWAPRNGQVIVIKDDSDRGGPSKEFENDANFITLRHLNEFSQLVHLGHKQVLVRPNDWVEEGQLLGYTGSTGWTYEPHLHFMVFKVLDENKFQSLKIRFKNMPPK